MSRSIVEALVVIAVGVAVGLGFNASRGDQRFVLTRNHFAKRIIATPAERGGGVDDADSAGDRDATQDADAPNDNHLDSNAGKRAQDQHEVDSDAVNPNDEAVSDEWKALVALGYQPIRHEQVVADFQSPQYRAELIIFVDARDDANYALAHIPGAYQLDHYLLDNYIDTVLPACQNAMKVVVYCNGGECEDSMFAAGDLIEQGVDPSKVFVYVGGVDAWKRDGLPFERGERYSGDEVYLNE